MARKVINRRVRYETEHAAQKKEGHAFFPYAMFHDVVVNLLVVLIIVAMAVVWHATAGPINASHPTGSNGLLGALYENKANPAVAQTEPRPEWYFLFLFELLRVFKQPWQLIFATIIIPTLLMVLLIAWPFLDTGRDRRLSRRPAGVALGLATPAVLIALTIAGASAPGAISGANISKNPAINALPGSRADRRRRLRDLPRVPDRRRLRAGLLAGQRLGAVRHRPEGAGGLDRARGQRVRHRHARLRPVVQPAADRPDRPGDRVAQDQQRAAAGRQLTGPSR